MTILNQEQIMTNTNDTGMLFLFFIAFILVIILAMIPADVNDGIFWVIVTAIITCVIGAIILCFSSDETGTGRYKYEVLLSDEIDFKEIYEKYDIKEQRGEIWVLEDKEVEE